MVTIGIEMERQHTDSSKGWTNGDLIFANTWVHTQPKRCGAFLHQIVSVNLLKSSIVLHNPESAHLIWYELKSLLNRSACMLWIGVCAKLWMAQHFRTAMACARALCVHCPWWRTPPRSPEKPPWDSPADISSLLKMWRGSETWLLQLFSVQISVVLMHRHDITNTPA